MRGTQVRTAGATLLATVLLAACGGGGSTVAQPDAPSTTGAAAPAACRAFQPPPVGATDSTTAPGDLDGDGSPDRLTTFRIASSGPWHVRADLASGGASEVQLPASAQGVKALGAYRLDVGPSEAGLAVVGTTAAGVKVGFFVVRSCRLEQVTVGGTPAEFPIQGGAGARAGLSCQAAGLVTYTATSTDGQIYQGSTVSYLLLGNLFDEVHRAAAPIAANDPALAPYGAFVCGSLKL